MAIPPPFTESQLVLLQRGEAPPDLQQEVAQRVRVLLAQLTQYEVRGRVLEDLLKAVRNGVLMHPNKTQTAMVDEQGKVWVLQAS